MTGRREDNKVITFINLVKTHECIWNSSIAEYSKTDVTGAAWREIARQIRDTEKNCRERWKNIRTAYVRSLKPPKPGATQNSKKSYYLAEHLTFLQPHLKVGDTFGNLHVDDTGVEEFNTDENDGSEAFVEVEMSDEASSVPLVENPVCKRSTPITKKQKMRGNDQIDVAFIKRMKMKKSVSKSSQEAEEHFLLSLLPDLVKLSSRRKRTFKMETMSLLHRLLDEDERENEEFRISVASSPSVWSSSSHDDTLQTQSHIPNIACSSALNSITPLHGTHCKKLSK